MNSQFIKSVKLNWEQIEDNSYLKNMKVLQNLKELQFNQNITFFVGENGTGKSTLLEGIAVAYGFNPEGGTMNYRFSTYDSHSSLSHALTLSKGLRPRWHYFLRAESFYNVITQEEEYRDGTDKELYYQKYGGKSLHEYSHGESFLSLMKVYVRGHGLYILDEPEASLSPQGQLSLFIHIYQTAKQGAQFIIATHSPILLAIPGATIFSFDDQGIHECRYEDTQCYMIMEMFMNNRERMIQELLK